MTELVQSRHRSPSLSIAAVALAAALIGGVVGGITGPRLQAFLQGGAGNPVVQVAPPAVSGTTHSTDWSKLHRTFQVQAAQGFPGKQADDVYRP